jgi:hypothetical protein
MQLQQIMYKFASFIFVWYQRYYEGRLSDQQTALLQYQRENLHFLSEEVSDATDTNTLLKIFSIYVA